MTQERGHDPAARAAEKRFREVEAHVAAIAELLELSRAHVDRVTKFLTGADRASVEALSAVAPMVAGVKEGGRWSIDAASSARRIGKPVSLVIISSGKGVDVELVTGKVRLAHEH